METMKKNRVPIIGVVLILVGAVLLLRQMDVITISWNFLIWSGLLLYGAALVIRSLWYNERKKIFWGTMCFLTGVLFLTKEFGFTHTSFSILSPAFLLILGLSFFMLFVFNPKDWHILIPSFIFLGLGITLMMTSLGFWYIEEVGKIISSYWPILLIIIGGTMLLKRRVRVEQ